MKYLSYLIPLLFLGCNVPQKETGKEVDQNRIRVKVADNRYFVIEVKATTASLNTMAVYGEGFPNSTDTILLADCDPYSSYIISDLDANGYAELLWQTHSVGSGTYATLYGIASNRDLSYTQIYIPDLPKDDPRFKYYTGHDYYRLEKDKLIQVFPVNHTNAKGSKVDSIRITYKLIAGEAGWILRADN